MAKEKSSYSTGFFMGMVAGLLGVLISLASSDSEMVKGAIHGVLTLVGIAVITFIITILSLGLI